MPKKEVKKTEQKEKKENRHFFKDFKAELKKVIWPTPKQLINNTVAVITIVLITALIVFALDLVFESVNNYGINNLKGIVETQHDHDHNNETTENTTNSEATNNEVTNNTTNNATNTTDAKTENE